MGDVMFLLIKIALTVGLCLHLGAIYGLAVFIVLNYLVDLAIRTVFDLQPMNSTDKNVFYDQETNRCNVLAALVFEKMKAEDFAPVVEEDLPRIYKRFRSKVVKVMDNYYFKELRPEELKSEIKKAVTVRNDINTWEDAQNLMSEVQNVTYPDDGLQWQVWICPNFANNESIAIFKQHHAICDGMGIMVLFGTLQEDYHPSQFIQTTQVLNAFQQFVMYLIKPFSLLYAFLWFLIWSTDVNCIKGNTVKLNGHKNNAICKAFDVNEMKKIAAYHNKATLNDVVLSFVSVAMQEYMHK